MLVERFGHVMAYWLVAGGLAAIGIVAAIAVSVKEQEEEKAEQLAEEADTQEVVSDATAQAMVQTPIALLGALFTTPGGATSALSVARLLGRNFPLVLLLVMIGALFWPTKEELPVDEDAGDCADAQRLRRDAELHETLNRLADRRLSQPDEAPAPAVEPPSARRPSRRGRCQRTLSWRPSGSPCPPRWW